MNGSISEMLCDSDREWSRDALQRTVKKLSWSAKKNHDKIPYTTGPDGTYDDRKEMNEGNDWGRGLAWWTNGFFGGILWQLYHLTGEESFRTFAEHQEELLDPCFDNYVSLHHDVGFMWMPTAAADVRLTGSEKARVRAMHAASLLAGRFNPAGKFIRAWNGIPGEDTRGWAIIDCMINLSLLYWASEESGDPRFLNIAMAHADTVRNTFFRPDGSANHIVVYDPERGGVVKTLGGQGYAQGSTWTRGQAWAIYGFVISYLHTKKESYLEQAVKTAACFVKRMPESGLIPVDFDQPKEPNYLDCCGGAAAASGMLSLAEILFAGNEEESGRTFLAAAVKILRAIDSSSADYTENCDAIVQNCSGAYHASEHHMTMIYADYYYLEALLKLADSAVFLW